LDKYAVKLLPRAFRDIDQIYGHIAEEFKAPETAKKMVDELEEAILNLDLNPYRGAERRVGVYGNRGYRQLFVKNFTVLYRVDEKEKSILIVTVRYSPSRF